MNVERLLRDVRVPEEEQAQERSWHVVRAGFEQREPLGRRRPVLRPVLAVAVVVAVVSALASAPGRAVLDSVREAVGVERAQPALFSLPAPGQLLSTSAAGSWVVADDGSKRLLGPYEEASWSPFGRFVVAARANALAALEPDGTVRWTLARPDVRFPRWGGTPTDTAIAYLSGSALHVVAGDGTGDHEVAGDPAAVAPAWQPGSRHVLAYVTTRGRVTVLDPATGTVQWRSEAFARPRTLEWSADGSRLLLLTGSRLVLFPAGRPEPLATRPAPGAVAVAFAPAGDRIALLRPREVLLLDANRLQAAPEQVFGGAGRFAGVTWSPDGRWLLVEWPAADQWVFVTAAGTHRIEAVSDISGQFEGSFPVVEGWTTRP